MKIEIRTHDGLVVQEEVASYNEIEVASILNGEGNNLNMVVFGKTVLNRHNVKMVRPVEVAPEATPEPTI